MSKLKLYAVQDVDSGEIRLIDANSQSVARNHVVRDQYKVWLPTSRETAHIMAQGVNPESVEDAPFVPSESET